MRMQKNGPVVYKRPFADDGEFNPPFLNTMIRMNACMTRKIFVLNWFSMTMTHTHEKKSISISNFYFAHSLCKLQKHTWSRNWWFCKNCIFLIFFSKLVSTKYLLFKWDSMLYLDICATLYLFFHGEYHLSNQSCSWQANDLAQDAILSWKSCYFCIILRGCDGQLWQEWNSLKTIL